MAPFDDAVSERDVRELHAGVERLLRAEARPAPSSSPLLWGNVALALIAVATSLLAAAPVVSAAAAVVGAATVVTCLGRTATVPRAALRPAVALGLALVVAVAVGLTRAGPARPGAAPTPVTQKRLPVAYSTCYMKPTGRPECHI